MTKPALSAILEVERKFCSLAVKDLVANTGTPAFKSIRALPQRTIHDAYYDNPSRSLMRAGIWVRQRNGQWEAKVKRGGNYTNSMFEELAGADRVQRCIKEITGKEVATGEPHFGLNRIAALSTMRESWIADSEFKIVLDTMDFGHTVGEVELQEEVQFPGEREKRWKMKEMDGRIARFMEQYSWAFRPGVPKGKLTVYFELQAAGKIP
jgi:thiamine-triphosphatase